MTEQQKFMVFENNHDAIFNIIIKGIIPDTYNLQARYKAPIKTTQTHL